MHIHWLLPKKYGIPTGNKRYSYVPNVVTERDDGKVTIYRDKPIKTDKKVSYNRPDVVVIDRDQKMWYTVDSVIPTDHHAKENEEIEDIIGSLQTAVLISTTAIIRTVLILEGPG